MIFDKKTLYSKDSRGNMRYWSICATDDQEIETEHGTVGGAPKLDVVSVDYGLSNRTVEEQILLMVNSKIKSKLDAGYVESLEDAKNNQRVNSIGLLRPMLAQSLKNVKINDSEEIFYQHKYNGNRCLITNVSGENIAYSRQGKYIETIPEILESIKIPEGVTIDGELYCHGYKLQTINSWIKKRQPETRKLVYMCYDIITEEYFEKRWWFLNEFVKFQDLNFAMTVPTWHRYFSKVDALVSESIAKGYEGGIIRLKEYPYEHSKRSKSLIKVKRFHDKEFLVKNIVESREGFAILVCVTDKGKIFRALAPGDHFEKSRIFHNRQDFIGKYIQIEYPEFTADGIPVHPVAKRWRNPSED
jgi:ATP-dependent DNA ligase